MKGINCGGGQMDGATRAIRDNALRSLTGTSNVRSIARSQSRNVNIQKAKKILGYAKANTGLKVGSQGYKANISKMYRSNATAGQMQGKRATQRNVGKIVKTYMKK